MKKTICVLFITCSQEYVEFIGDEMEKWGFSTVYKRVDTFEGTHAALENEKWDLVICDYSANRFASEEALSLISGYGKEIPLILVSDNLDEDDMTGMIEKGCSDCILKNDLVRLRLTVYRVLREKAVYNEHKKVMKEFFEDNKRLMDTIDSIGDGVIVTGKEGNIIMLNKAAQKFTGWCQQEALGNSFSEVFRIIDKVSRIQAENPLDKVLKERVSIGLKRDTVLVSRDGTERYVSANCSPIITGQHELIGAIVVFRDITRIRQAEKEAINEQRNLTAIFDAVPVGMLLLDRNIAIKKVNSSFFSALGIELSQNTGERIGDIFNCINSNKSEKGCGYSDECENCELYLVLKQACSSENAILNTDIQYTILINGNKTELWLRISTVPVIIDGERLTLVIIDDITGLKRMHEDLENINKELQKTLEELKLTQDHMIQQEKLAGIGQLAAGVAHEINNPLGFVISNFETLKRYVSKYKEFVDMYRDLKNSFLKSESEKIKTKINNINNFEIKERIDFITEDLEDLFKDTYEGLERISKIIIGLRLFSRVDQQNDYAEYDLNEGIRNTLIVAHNEIKYYAEVEERLQDIPPVYANGGQINQVLLNLIVNAVHAIRSKDTGQLGLIKITTSCDDKYIYCCIEDNGVGIPPENISKIFDPFYTTKSVGKGTGLGLSISYDIIVNKHQGELLVNSIPGAGSRFTVKLPIHNRN